MAYLQCLLLNSFRNYQESTFEFGEGINYIHGKNGLGKSNILEAIYMLSTGRSFRLSKLAPMIQYQKERASISAYFQKLGVKQDIHLMFDDMKRVMQHNRTKKQGFSHLLGLIPSVIHSPSDIEIIMGQPGVRRRFLNMLIAQYDPTYTYHLFRSAKALKQRSALLRQKSIQTLPMWEEILIDSALYIMKCRQEMLEELSTLLEGVMRRLAPKEEVVHLKYRPSFHSQDKEAMRKELESHWQKDLALASTAIGIHRDDFTIKLSEKEAKTFASEGQKRTLLVALRIAEWELLKEKSDSLPLFCIDDFGSHLDEERTCLLRDSLEEMGQVFLTSPRPLFDHSECHYIELS